MATTQQVLPHTWPKIKKIAVLTDFSQSADTALRFAAAFARGYGADIVLGHAYLPASCAYAAPKVKLVYQFLGSLLGSDGRINCSVRQKLLTSEI